MESEKKEFVTIDDAQQMLDEIAESLPAEFYVGLNGGILLLEEEKESPYAKNDDLYIMGEYCRSSSMGRYIKIYYGSFAHMYANYSEEFWYRKLREVLVHEFTHHLEFLAGERGLEIKDEQQIHEYLKAHANRAK